MADASPKTPINSASQLPTDHANPSKFFFYKTALVTVFLLLLPLFPSLAPDFINQTFHARSWELLQLIFVGIAVSYGLFSKKNDNSHISKMDNAQSYVSKLLQVSSVFDEESDNHTLIEENKFQALNSQYYRGEPVVVVAKESPAAEETNAIVSHINQKPLLLPVRSLKQRANESGSTRFSDEGQNSRSEEEEDVVLPSPIPWRSRSGRMEMKKDEEEPTPSMEEEEFHRVKPRLFRSPSSRANASPSSPKLSSESQSEDGVKRRSFAPPPPAPPPPPSSPPFLRKSSSSIVRKPDAGSPQKLLRRSVRSVPTEELNEKEINSVKSVRIFTPNEVETKESKDYETKFVHKSYTREVQEEKEEVEEKKKEEEEEYERSSSSVGEVSDVGPDVDKKADEFIAKFREQIRLQRIESIRRSTAQRAGKSLR